MYCFPVIVSEDKFKLAAIIFPLSVVFVLVFVKVNSFTISISCVDIVLLSSKTI